MGGWYEEEEGRVRVSVRNARKRRKRRGSEGQC